MNATTLADTPRRPVSRFRYTPDRSLALFRLASSCVPTTLVVRLVRLATWDKWFIDAALELFLCVSIAIFVPVLLVRVATANTSVLSRLRGAWISCVATGGRISLVATRHTRFNLGPGCVGSVYVVLNAAVNAFGAPRATVGELITERPHHRSCIWSRTKVGRFRSEIATVIRRCGPKVCPRYPSTAIEISVMVGRFGDPLAVTSHLRIVHVLPDLALGARELGRVFVPRVPTAISGPAIS